MSEVSNVCRSVLSGPKRRYTFPSLITDFSDLYMLIWAIQQRLKFRKSWMKSFTRWDAEKLIFIEGSGANECTDDQKCDYTHCWSHILHIQAIQTFWTMIYPFCIYDWWFYHTRDSARFIYSAIIWKFHRKASNVIISINNITIMHPRHTL